MPVLHEYSSSYHKSGYYVKVNWSAPHPYPLQTPAITEQIYLELGFEDGDEVPNQLTSRLFNAGLHWTEGNGTGDPQTQENLKSIEDADVPDLSREQLERLDDILDRVEKDKSLKGVDQDALSDLRKELRKLERTDSGGSGRQQEALSDSIVTIVEDLKQKAVGREGVKNLRDSAVSPTHFDTSVEQFARKHPITPREFGINNHGDPAYTFQTGPVSWTLADCRPKSLNFDWAVTVKSSSTSAFALRVSADSIWVAGHHHSISNQQATNLLTALPCLLWTLDQVPSYNVRKRFRAKKLKQDLPAPQRNWLEGQTKAALKSLHNDVWPDEGVLVDIPEQYFARIRTLERCIICVPVNSLPENTSPGTTVTFDIEQRGGVQYATNVSTVGDIEQQHDVSVRLSEGGETHLFRLSEDPTEDASKTIKVLESVFATVTPSTAFDEEAICKALTSIDGTTVDISGLLKELLASTPFHPEIFEELVTDLSTHHRIPEESATFRPLPLACAIAAFYETLDVAAAREEMDGQGDTTMLYTRGDVSLIVGNELIWHFVADALKSPPSTIKKSITQNHHLWANPFARALTAICERQFHYDCPVGDTFISKVLGTGIQEHGFNVIYLSAEKGSGSWK